MAASGRSLRRRTRRMSLLGSPVAPGRRVSASAEWLIVARGPVAGWWCGWYRVGVCVSVSVGCAAWSWGSRDSGPRSYVARSARSPLGRGREASRRFCFAPGRGVTRGDLGVPCAGDLSLGAFGSRSAACRGCPGPVQAARACLSRRTGCCDAGGRPSCASQRSTRQGACPSESHSRRS